VCCKICSGNGIIMVMCLYFATIWRIFVLDGGEKATKWHSGLFVILSRHIETTKCPTSAAICNTYCQSVCMFSRPAFSDSQCYIYMCSCRMYSHKPGHKPQTHVHIRQYLYTRMTIKTHCYLINICTQERQYKHKLSKQYLYTRPTLQTHCYLVNICTQERHFKHTVI